jgi:hypothetical protein
LTGFVRSTERKDFKGFVGMLFTVGSAPLTVTDLGRMYASGNGTHTLKLVVQSSGADVPGGFVTITAGGTPGQFQYAALAAPVTLAANTSYYVEIGDSNSPTPAPQPPPQTKVVGPPKNGNTKLARFCLNAACTMVTYLPAQQPSQ